MSKSVEEILSGLDPFDPEQGEHWEEALAVARQQCPVVRSPEDGGYYFLTKYDDVRSVCERPDEFSSSHPAVRGMEMSGVRLIPLDVDQPLHRDFRKILNQYFSLSYVRRHEGKMRDICKGLLDKIEKNGQFDFVRDYAIPYSAGVLSCLIFTNESEEYIQRAVTLVERFAADLSTEAFLELGTMAVEALNRADESCDDDSNILSVIKSATVDGGRPLTLEEQVGIVAALLAGGLDTTRSAMANIAFHLATRPELEERLRDPRWVRNDLDEFLRLQPTVSFSARTATCDTTVGEHEFKSGDRIVLSFLSANRDESRYDNSEELVFGADRKASAAFGLGIHRCIGQHLAKLQIEIGFDELLSRMTKLRIQDGADIPRQVGVSAGAPEHLPLTFERTSIQAG